MVVQSPKMDQYPLRPWDDNLSAIKAPMYHAICNRPDIAYADTLLAHKAQLQQHCKMGVKEDIHRYLYGTIRS